MHFDTPAAPVLEQYSHGGLYMPNIIKAYHAKPGKSDEMAENAGIQHSVIDNSTICVALRTGLCQSTQ